MKKLLLLALGVVLPGLAFGQGSLYFALGAAAVGGNGQPAVAAPCYVKLLPAQGGSTKTDTTYSFTIIGAPHGTGTAANNGLATTAATTFADAVGFQLGQVSVAGANVLKTGNTAGTFASPGPVSMPGVGASGSIADVQVLAWKTSMGSTWTAAYAAWIAHPNDDNYLLGVSALQTITVGAFSDTVQPRLGPQVLPSDLAKFCSTPGITSFAVVQSVPEPGVLALAGLGLVGAFVIRRRK